MDILNFFKMLLPKFSKSRVLEDARITLSSLETVAIPSYVAADTGLKSKKFKSKQIDAYTKLLQRNVKIKNGDNIVTIILRSLEKVQANLRILSDKANEEFEDEIVVAGITILKLNIIKLINIYSFTVQYSLKFLNYIYILETAELNADDRYVKDSLSAGDIKWLEDNFLNFCLSMNVATKSDKEFVSTLDSIPDIALGTSPDATVATLGGLSKVDPFGTSTMRGFTGSPIYSVRMMIAQYQAFKYKEAKETKTMLELRLLNLQKALDKSPDAALEKEINYTQSRVDNLNAELRQMEGVV